MNKKEIDERYRAIRECGYYLPGNVHSFKDDEPPLTARLDYSLSVKVRRFCRAFVHLDNMTALLLALAFTSFGFLLCALYMNYK